MKKRGEPAEPPLSHTPITGRWSLGSVKTQANVEQQMGQLWHLSLYFSSRIGHQGALFTHSGGVGPLRFGSRAAGLRSVLMSS